MRFPEFSGEWDYSTIGSEFELYSGNTPSRLDKEQFTGDVNWISSGELKEHYIYDTKEKITEEAASCNNLRLLPIGTFVIAIYGLEAEGVRGTGSVTQKKSTISQACMAFSSKGAITNEFLYSWYKKHGNLIGLKYAQGTKQQNLSYDIISQFKISYPSKKEQKKLEDFISLLDERLATQNKIIEKLESLIKGITDKLLCNFSWEKVYLRSFMEFYPTNSFSWEQLSYEKGTIRNLHYGLIHGISTKSVTTKTLPFISSNKADSRFVCCHNGDVAFADASEDTADIGKAVEFTDVDNTNVVCGLHTIHGRDVKELTIVGFKGFMFNSSYFHEQVRRVAQGTKVFSISANNLSSCYVYIPDKSEQTKITGLLYSMEMKISLSSKLLERYKIQKEYLLRQMFI